MSTLLYQSFGEGHADGHGPQVGNAYNVFAVQSTYQRIIVEDTIIGRVSFQGIDDKCYAEHSEQWVCNCLGKCDPFDKCEHVRWLESFDWRKLVAWSQRPKTMIYWGELQD